MGSSHPGAPLDPDELYDALSNARRRACLEYLNGAEGELRVRDIARSVAGETADDPDGVAKSVYVSLIQIHLPKLAAYEIITYDETEKLVAPGPAYGQALACLTAHTGDADLSLRERLSTIVMGASLVALAIALVIYTHTRFILWLVLALQLVAFLVSIVSTLQARTLESRHRYR